MKKQILFSIICPAYNAQSFINDTIQSVLTQSYKHWELIIINDGSFDNTLQICEKYASLDRRIRCISQSNSGQYIAREKGIAEGAGDYYVFLDSDDLMSQHCLFNLNQIIQNNDVDIIHYEMDTISENTKIEDIKPYEKCRESESLNTNAEILREFLLRNKELSLYLTCVKREIIKKCINDNSIFTTFKNNEDFYMHYKIIKLSKRAIKINDILYYYRINKNSISHNFKIDHYYQSFIIHNYIYADFFKNNVMGIDFNNIEIEKLAYMPLNLFKKSLYSKKQIYKFYSDVKPSFIYQKITNKFNFKSRKAKTFRFLINHKMIRLAKFLNKK